MQNKYCSLIYSKNKDYDPEKGSVWLGDFGSLKMTIIKGNQINAIISILQGNSNEQKNQVKNKVQKLGISNILSFEVKDNAKYKIGEWFAKTYNFLQQNLKETNVIVCCRFGISRSATVVISFLMRLLKIQIKQAFDIVKQKRQNIRLNKEFLQTLTQYQKQMNVVYQNSMKIVQQKDRQKYFNEEMNKLILREPVIQYTKIKGCNHIMHIHGQQYQPIMGNLWLGGVTSFQDQIPKILKITAVLSVLDERYMKKCKIVQKMQHYGIKNHKWINLMDEKQINILSHFQDCNEFIDEHLKIGNVLVHCFAGVSRSASVVIAYLMKKNKIKYNQALKYTQDKRYIVKPNQGFEEQLIKYQFHLDSTQKG